MILKIFIFIYFLCFSYAFITIYNHKLIHEQTKTYQKNYNELSNKIWQSLQQKTTISSEFSSEFKNIYGNIFTEFFSEYLQTSKTFEWITEHDSTFTPNDYKQFRLQVKKFNHIYTETLEGIVFTKINDDKMHESFPVNLIIGKSKDMKMN